MSESPSSPYVSRSGLKLAAALDAFGIHPRELVCADLGCNVGGFTDCLLQRGAARVYAIDTGYGTLAWTLRNHQHVIVMERTNAMHVALPEPVDLITIDVAWTPQYRILPNARQLLRNGGQIVTLIKPHYEADRKLLRRGVLPPDVACRVFERVCDAITRLGFSIHQTIESPITGHKGNTEFLAWLATSPRNSSSN